MSKKTISAKIPDRLRPKLPEEVEAAARSDLDAQPLGADDLKRMRRTPQPKIIRRALGLTQEEFSARYRIPIGTLRDWEQGRTEPDQPARAYLTAIARDPEGLRQALRPRLPTDARPAAGEASEGTKGLQTEIAGEHFMHRQLWRVVRRQIDHATANPIGAFHDHIVTMTFAFHTLEAYLNFLGPRLAPGIWRDERNFFRREPYRGIDGKLRKVLELAQVPEPDRSDRPYSTVWLLKELRDMITHAQAERFSQAIEYPPEYPASLREETRVDYMPFGALVTAENAHRAATDVEEFIERIHSAAKLLIPDDIWFGAKALSGPLAYSSGRTGISS